MERWQSGLMRWIANPLQHSVLSRVRLPSFPVLASLMELVDMMVLETIAWKSVRVRISWEAPKTVTWLFCKHQKPFVLANFVLVNVYQNKLNLSLNAARDVAQFGSVPALGAGGRRFESYHLDLAKQARFGSAKMGLVIWLWLTFFTMFAFLFGLRSGYRLVWPRTDRFHRSNRGSNPLSRSCFG